MGTLHETTGYETRYLTETLDADEVRALDEAGEAIPEALRVVEYWDVYRQQTRRAYDAGDIPDETMAALPHADRERIRAWLEAD